MKYFLFLICISYSLLSFGQCTNNPAIQQASMSADTLVKGAIDTLQFSFFENLFDYTDEENNPIILTIDLFEIEPTNLTSPVTGSFSNIFNWSYDTQSNRITGVQNQNILGGTGGLLEVEFFVSGPASCTGNPNSGFKAFITPPPCMNGQNQAVDDTVSVYTCIVLECENNPSILQQGLGTGLLYQGDIQTFDILFLENLLDYTDEENDPIIVIIDLFLIEPLNHGVPVIGSFASKFAWSYDYSTNRITGVQQQNILSGTGGLFTVEFIITGEKQCFPGFAGYNTFLTIPECMEKHNLVSDDTTGNLTCVLSVCDVDVCMELDLGGGNYNGGIPYGGLDCDGGGTNNITECYQGTDPNVASDDCPNGVISGCNLVCLGTSGTNIKQFSVNFNKNIEWSFFPAHLPAANHVYFTSGQGTNNVEVSFNDFTAPDRTITLMAKGTSNCGTEVRFLTIYLDDQCVWPGDANHDNQPGNRFGNWVTDVLQHGFALRTINQIPTTDTLIPATRSSACLTGSLTDWEPQACPDWNVKTAQNTIVPFNLTFLDSLGQPDSLNVKYADCNGDGAFVFEKNWNNLIDSFPTVGNPSDHDVMFYHALKDNTHNGNSGTANKNNPLFDVLTLDTIYNNGSAVNFNILMGDLINQIPDVTQVAFVVEATLGIDPLPFTLLNNSHLTTDPVNMITYADFPNGYTGNMGDSLHYYVALHNPAQSVTFSGEQVCNLVCVATVAGLLDHGGSQGGNLNPVDSLPITLKISAAAIGTNNNATIYSSSDPYTVHVLLDPLLNAKVFLEGCSNLTTNMMDDDLRADTFIPFAEPYALDSNTTYPIPELKGIQLPDSSLMNVTGPTAIVDWMFVEIRDPVDTSILVWSRAAFVNRQGYIVDLDGVSPLQLSRLPRGNYHVMIRHRTHLPVITKTPVYLDRSGNLLDFTTGQNVSTQSLLASGSYAMIVGDSNGDHSINAQDRSNLWNQRNSIGYFSTDINMDGVVNAADRSVAWNQRNLVFTGQ